MGFDPLEYSHATYEASALPPSHHGWIVEEVNQFKLMVIRQTIKKEEME